MEKRVLIARWLRSHNATVPVYDEGSVSSARQQVRETGEQLNLSNEVVESVALIATELAHNHLAHAKQGYIAVNALERDGVRGLEVIAADTGCGIASPRTAIQDDASRQHLLQGSLGAGLAAVYRLADEVAFDNRLLEGACVVARKFAAPARACCESAIMGRPYPGEVISGDDGIFFESETHFMAAVVDGLGHGPEAREASNRAIELLIERNHANLDEILAALNTGLAGTRGCAINIVRVDKRSRVAECVSAGDVHAHLYHLRDAHFFTPTPVVLAAGQFHKQRIRVETVTVEPGSVLVMFTDGLKSKTTLKNQLDILRQPAIAIAQHLLETSSRPDDDALVLVTRFPR